MMALTVAPTDSMQHPVQPADLILASTSPRRRELLQERGYQFETIAPPYDELDERSDVPPINHAESIAYFKASSVAKLYPGRTVLGADTIAFINGQIIGKPADRQDARRILRMLSGTDHEVITGVALVCRGANRRAIDHDISVIRVRELSDEAIEAYLDTGLWEGKAGAYGIQDEGDPFVETITGSYSNVVGLPMELIERMFEKWQAAQ